MSIDKKRLQIRQKLIGAQNKRVLLVEGTDDEAALRILLGRFVPGWEQGWAISPAGNKRQVLALLALEPDWLGLVDRDEWDAALIQQRQTELPNLMVLPRFCLENYLINPTELWAAIPKAQQANVVGGIAGFETEFITALPKYLRHGVLWQVVSPLWSGLRTLGFKEALASQNSVPTAQDDDAIRQTLGTWHQLLDPATVFADFQTQLKAAHVATRDVQLSQWVHGKIFWQAVVSPCLNRLFGSMSEAERRKKILHNVPFPADLQPIFDRFT